jgi:hypothetical protein
LKQLSKQAKPETTLRDWLPRRTESQTSTPIVHVPESSRSNFIMTTEFRSYPMV